MISQDREQDIKCCTIYLVWSLPLLKPTLIFLACIGSGRVGPCSLRHSMETTHPNLPLDKVRTGPEPVATHLIHRGRIMRIF